MCEAPGTVPSTVDIHSNRNLLTLLCCLFPPQPSAFEEKAIEKVDDLLESYMGIRDTELGEWGHPCLEGGSRLPGLIQAELSLHPSVPHAICVHLSPP